MTPRAHTRFESDEIEIVDVDYEYHPEAEGQSKMGRSNQSKEQQRLFKSLVILL